MIHVVATALIKEGCLTDALNCYRDLVPQVLGKESGCLEYSPTLDRNLGLANQTTVPHRILVVERWRTEQDFRDHLAMAHCAEFRSRIAPHFVAPISIEITAPALLQPCLQSMVDCNAAHRPG